MNGSYAEEYLSIFVAMHGLDRVERKSETEVS